MNYLKYQVMRKKLSFVFGATGTELSQKIACEGTVEHIHIRTPDFFADSTSTVTIKDEDGYEIYTSGAKSENANYNITNMVVQLSGINTITVTLSVDAGGPPPNDYGGTVIVVIHYLGWEPIA